MPRFSSADLSISNNSVFDWGTLPSSGSRDGLSTLASDEGRPAASGEGNKEPSARYDPKAMTRITDITDLVDDTSGSDSDDDVVGSNLENGIIGRNRRLADLGSSGSALWCRQFILLVALVGIIVGASVAIGYAVLNADPNKSPYSVAEGPQGGNAEVPQQQLLEIAERVVTACDKNRLNEDMKECQQLCHLNMCCFESGQYSCEDDKTKDCAVYAGCQALVVGIPMGAAEEDEE
mmetsp:Transcript_23625/g.51157  ORF Transcript_23625/g.51157 Transcript_23625/m.51157 type:complete len:235 (+) Transcript_23625:139-843(+)|eukprot:CAMPEP_0172312112 /NCGR_PEP_ID=MMETSP1058-20130122/16672_1 /TAXON_ID=83371 /ORGANISM="Detonula confervacea, Strain CCMP 353" /LENGTH=234 /DNA_ID=CAMNT_0013025471 /DNA_START=90 /DNA_END=794 /DNA_ORIENTATION=-